MSLHIEKTTLQDQLMLLYGKIDNDIDVTNEYLSIINSLYGADTFISFHLERFNSMEKEKGTFYEYIKQQTLFEVFLLTQERLYDNKNFIKIEYAENRLFINEIIILTATQYFSYIEDLEMEKALDSKGLIP
ncbi:MAG: hypothetical protein [Bacteriophage sp.]|nr:MAG: hypothetical protein [Bacteriophage sp.]